MTAVPSDARNDDWQRFTELCVSCPYCAFTFDSVHVTHDTGEYDCPVCEVEHLLAQLARAENVIEAAREIQRVESESQTEDGVQHVDYDGAYESLRSALDRYDAGKKE